MDEAQRVRDAEHAPQHGDEAQRNVERLHRALDGQGFGEEHLLGEKAVEERHAGHGRGRDHRERRRHRHEAIKPVEAPDVARAAFVIDHARGHEKRCLERGVIQDVETAATAASALFKPSSTVMSPRWLMVE